MHWPGKFFRASYKLIYITFRVSGREKKKLRPLALEGFEKIDFNFWKKSYKYNFFFIFFGYLIVPSDRKSREDHESPHFCGSTTLSFWVMAILRYFFKKYFEFLNKIFCSLDSLAKNKHFEKKIAKKFNFFSSKIKKIEK